MSLYEKQDFNPPVLSRRWIMMKIRPNVLLYSAQHISSILESGLLFREDCVEVEQETQLQDVATGWFTRGEQVVSALAVGVAIALAHPKRLTRTSALYLAAYATIPVSVRATHRHWARGSLQALLLRMRDYLALARRAQACLKECAAFRSKLGSVSTVLESMHTLLCRQQTDLAVLLARASSAILGNAPWLTADLAWGSVPNLTEYNLKQIHHAFLVIQSTFLKHLALSHSTPPVRARRLYRNHNERIYWIHTVIVQHLTEEFKENHETLERMYRLLKNYGNSDTSVTKKPGAAVKDSWYYSEVHAGVARANLELKLALNQCNELDLFLDTCALNNHDLDIKVLNKDIDNLIDNISKSLNTIQNSQLRLKKLQSKVVNDEKIDEEHDDMKTISDEAVKIEDVTPEVKDEVFYFVKTENDEPVTQSSVDISTVPGKSEKDATKLVLNELRRKLVRREDAMRERERQALAKTMDIKDEVPEFPRQINLAEYAEKKGYISKLPKKLLKKRLFHNYKIKPLKSNYKTLKIKRNRKYADEKDLEIKASSSTLYEVNSNYSLKNKLLSFERVSDTTIVTEWYRKSPKTEDFDSCGLSDTNNVDNKTIKRVEAVNDIRKNALEAINTENKDIFEANEDIAQAVNSKLTDFRNGKIHNDFKSKQDGDSKIAKNEAKNARRATKSTSNLETSNVVRNYRFSKRDLELSSSSETESDFELYKEKQIALLKDIRKYRAARKKNHPDKRASNPQNQPHEVDESLRPMEYNFGTGLAMASVLQSRANEVLGNEDRRANGVLGNEDRRANGVLGREEQFIGEGDLSLDSGNDETEA